MRPLHARYPFFESAREAVEAAGISLPSLIEADAPAVERGLERVERALMEGTVAPEDPYRWEPREELLSYPIARILVSLVDAPAAVQKYADAEATTAYERFVEDFSGEGLRSTGPQVTFVEFVREFDLGGEIRQEPDHRPEAGRPGGSRAGDERASDRFRLALGTYLDLVVPGWGDDWRLVAREVRDGRVIVTREELYRLLQEAVRERVADGLPIELGGAGEDLADALAPEVATLRDLLADRAGARVDIDTVVPSLFPPCMKHLLARARREADLDPHSRFALTAFLTGIGMDTDEVVRLHRESSLDEETIRYQTEYLRDRGGTQYPPPSCATMQAYGDCVNPDERCETIAHPLSYYSGALSDADAAELDDWRETSETTDGDGATARVEADRENDTG